jgi:biopolymer transport protein ExbD
MIRLRRPPHPAPRETIAPLIDVVFFLLVFALLSGRMDATAPFTVEPPVSDAKIPLPQGGATVSIAADGALALDGVQIGRADLVARLSEGDGAGRGAVPFVRINADAAAPLRLVLPLVAALEAGGVPRIALVVTPDGP